MPFASHGTSSALTDAEEDGEAPKASQIVLGPRQKALKERRGTAHASAAHSSAKSRAWPGQRNAARQPARGACRGGDEQRQSGGGLAG